MTTTEVPEATQEVKEVVLPWDAFLKREAEWMVTQDGGTTEGREQRLRAHIDGFRRVEWPNINRQLATEHGYVLPEGLEPHWVSPGHAVLWQEHVVRVAVLKEDEDGRKYRVLENQSRGWYPTDRGQPLGNATQTAYYLRKGLRLRPPENGVDGEVLKAAVPPEALQVKPPSEEPKNVYFCARHGAAVGRYGFSMWKLYTKHCIQYQEKREYDPPEEVVKALAGNEFVCAWCLVPFKNRKHYQQHFTVERKRPGSRHPTLGEVEADAA